MIILNKKRLIIILSMVLISLFAFSIETIKNNNTVETVALPVANKIIVLDAGHGKPDERCRI